MAYHRFGGEVDYSNFIEYIQSLGFEYIGAGSFRRAYRRDKVVIKVPINGDGILDNKTEAAAWHKYKSRPTSKGYFLAPCRMLPNSCLMMVLVESCNYSSSVPETSWAERIEGHQIGMYRDKVVAFDFALNIPERATWEKEWGMYSEWFYANGWDNSEYQ
jgi:hypothetical protein